MRSIVHLLFLLLMLGASISYTHAQLYWKGGSGLWSDPAMWSSYPDGPPAGGVPSSLDDVIFLSPGTVLLDQPATCRSLIVPDGSFLTMQGVHSLVCHGDVSTPLEAELSVGSLHLSEGDHQISFQGMLANDLVIDDGARVWLQDNLQVQGNISVHSADLHGQGFGIITQSFVAEAPGTTLDLVGTKIVVSGELSVSASANVEESEPSVWPIDNAVINPGPLTVAWERSTTCGVGPGQTPFTIEATVSSDYNGEDVSCNGAEDGQTTVSVVGGIGPFSFTWIGGVTNGFLQTYSNLGAGTYTVLVTDLGQGITCVDNVQVTEPAAITVFDFVYSPPSCAGICDGIGTPIVIGGTAPYDFLWSNGETTQSATALCEGLNTLEFSDLNGCLFDTTFTVELNEIYANLSITDVLCNGTATGEAASAPTGGGGGPYTINWSTGDAGPLVMGLTAGDYTVTVTDNNGCSIDSSFTVSEEPPINITEDNVVELSCAGASDGAIDITVNGGAEPYSFDWIGPNSFSSLDEDLSGLEAGDYTLTLTDANGCLATVTVTVDEPPAIVIVETITDIDCFGSATGAIDIVISGGQPGYTTNWLGPNGFVSSIEDIGGLEAGSYDLTVTDITGCISTGNFLVNQADEITVAETIIEASCAGADDGAISVIVSGGTPTYSVAWTGPGGFASVNTVINGLAPGIYNFTVTDSNDCQESFSYEVTEPAAIDIAVDLTPVSCNAAADAAIDITVSGGSAPYDFTWSGPGAFSSSDEDLIALSPGTYELIVTDATGCQEPATVVVNEPDPITTVMVVNDLSCGGASDGSIELSIFGGTPGYTTEWTGPNGFTSSDEDPFGLEAGDYTVVITDLEGCQVTELVTVSENPPIVLDLVALPISCNGANDASIDLTVTGGQPPYQINWAGPSLFTSNDEDIFSLEPGLYNILVVDANGCFEESSVQVDEPAAIEVSATTSDVSCFGANDGSIDLIITGGIEPITVSWDTGDSGTSISGLSAGDYTPTVTDDSGCAVVFTAIVINEPAEIIITLNSTDILCATEVSGSIDATISGGVPDYDLSWVGPNSFNSTDEDLSSLEAGDYELTVTDASGCSATAMTTISEPTGIQIDVSTSELLCADDLGSIDITVSGGSVPYDYAWTGPGGFSSSSEDLIDLEQGVYDLVLTDDNGCVQPLQIDLTAPDALLVDALITDLDCTGDPIAAIDVTITGGTGPYDVVWTSTNGFNSTSEDISSLEEGVYDLTVTDQQACSLTQSFELIQPPALEVDATLQDPLCDGQNTGSIALMVSGGTAPYDVIWSGPGGFSSTSSNISNLEEGTYDLFVTDAGSCDAQLSFELIAPELIAVDFAVTDVLCGGEGTGAIDITISGGTAPYLVVWSAPGFASIDEDITDLVADSYQLDLQDANGCAFSQVVEVVELSSLELSIGTSDSTCGESNGTATASPAGGTDPLSVEWFDENDLSLGTGNTIIDLPAGNYYATLSDANACAISVPFSISDSDAMQLDAVPTDVLCTGDANGTIDLSITGGVGIVTVSWTNPEGFTSNDEDLADLVAGDYTATVTDENGCQASITVSVDEPVVISADATVANVSCGTTDTGAIDVVVSGGIEPYTFSWVGPGAFTSDSEDLTSLEAGIYDLSITDANSCISTLSVEVLQESSVSVDLTITDVACAGDADASISTTVLGGQAPFSFEWTGPGSFFNTNPDITSLESGSYNLVVIDALGCALDTTVSVSENPALSLSVDETAPSCLSNNGALEAQVSGGQVMTDYTYFWYDLNNGNALIGTEALLENIPAGVYYIEVFDDLGCTTSIEVSLSDNVGTIDVNATDPLCFGDANGTIDITVTGATAPYSYAWTGPGAFSSVSEDIADLVVGSYTVQVTDDLGCLLAATIDLTEPQELMLDLTAGDLLCADVPAGTILSAISGGTPDYVISWEGPDGFSSADQNLSDLAAGCYQAQVVDGNGCQATAEVCLDAPDSLAVVLFPTGITCFGDSTGSIEATITGGVGAYSVVWSGPGDFLSDQEDIFDLSAGSYQLTVTDLNFCTLDTVIDLSQNEMIVALADTLLPSCGVNSDGELSLTISGGLAPYTVAWEDESGPIGSGTTVTGLGPGAYYFAVEDAFGCVMNDSILLPVSEPFLIDTLVLDVSCFGENDGSIELEISGGQAPYTSSWVGPNSFSSLDEDVFALEPGTYELTLSDEQGCVEVYSFDIFEPVELEVSLDGITPASCLTSSDGAIEITVSGGNPDYEITWSNDEGVISSSEDLTGITIGSYDLEVIDASGCSVSLNDVPVNYSGDVSADAGADASFCAQEQFVIIGQSSGAQESYWTDIDGVEVAQGNELNLVLEPGNYTFIYVGVDNSCVDTDTLDIIIFSPPEVDAGLDQEVYFEEQVMLGGAPATNEENLFIWSPEEQLENPEDLNPTTVEMVTDTWFFLEVIDLNGCVAIDSVFIGIIPEIDVPSGFTPNGDNINDTWQLGNIGFYPSLEVAIYNRWGELLFRDTNGYVRPWDGRYNGNLLPIGTYYYVIEIDEPGFSTTLTGPVTILR